MRLTLNIILAFVIISCNNTNKISDDEYDIFSLLINELSIPLIAPPSFEELNSPKKLLKAKDSLEYLVKNKKVNVLIYSRFQDISEESKKINENEYTFSELLEADVIGEEKLITKNNINLYFTDNPETLKKKDLLKHDILLQFTKVYFNENHNKAIVEVANSRGSMSISKVLYFLKKVNDIWIIEKSKLLFIS